MNLLKIEFYQNGVKIDERCGIYKIDFDNISSARDIFHLTNGNYREHLVTTVVLVDADEDGHPEVIEGKVINPIWNEQETELVRQGYMLAMTQIRQECFFAIDSDAHKIHELHAIIQRAETSCQEGTPLTLNPNIRI